MALVDSGVRLIVGLGNPGPQYQATRHNVGFWLVDRLAGDHDLVLRTESKVHGMACRLILGDWDVRLLKPTTFMNRSGQSVVAMARYFAIRPQEILVVHDELDLPAGAVRLKFSGGHAGHNGLRDTVQQLGSRDFWRLRIGIGHPGDKSQVTSYVLSRASRDDEQRIMEAIDEACACLPQLLGGRFQLAMNRLHAAPQRGAAPRGPAD